MHCLQPSVAVTMKQTLSGVDNHLALMIGSVGDRKLFFGWIINRILVLGLSPVMRKTVSSLLGTQVIICRVIPALIKQPSVHSCEVHMEQACAGTFPGTTAQRCALLQCSSKHDPNVDQFII